MELQAEIIHTVSCAIVEQLRQRKITEPVYGLIVTYSVQEEDELCPWIAVGAQREREEILRKEPSPGLVLWDGEYLESFDPVESLLENGEFLDQCALWKQQAHAGEHAELLITALMQRICFALMKTDWKSVFPITEDFVIAACTYGGDWLIDNMSVLAGNETVERFLENGYLCSRSLDREEE